MHSQSEDTHELLRRGREGDDRAVDELFSRHTEKLRRMVRLRLDPRLRSRFGTDDIVQDVYAEAARRLPEYLHAPDYPFLLWLRSLTAQRLSNIHRDHIGAQARDVRREVRLGRPRMPQASSEAIAAQLVGHLTSPSGAAMRAEARAHLLEVLESMDERDREVLALRHFEHLSNTEVARELEIEEFAASKRYLRALSRMRKILETLDGGSWKEYLK